MKYSFSGHETFACKQYWLKKGVDYLQKEKPFTDDSAVVELGVGKNMVGAIRFWLRAFGIVDEKDKSTELTEYIFGENGKDIYLEDTLTLWLLHYQLIKQQKASIYSLVFNVFRRERQEFNKDHLLAFLKRKVAENKESFSESTLESDIKTFLNNYISSNPNDIEEGYSNVLQELNLLYHYIQTNSKGQKEDWYRFDFSPKADLPVEVVLYTILDNDEYGESVNLEQLANDPSGPGSVFLLTESALANKLIELQQEGYGVFTQTAGNSIFQVRSKTGKWDLLNRYYGKH